MSKVQSLYRVLSGFLSANKQNANLDRIEAAFENTLSRDGTSPNSMSAALDMNSNRIINVGDPVDNTDAVTLGYFDAHFDGDVVVGPEGPQGPEGPTGPQGDPGLDGADGLAATITVGIVSTGAPGTDVIVTNSGDEVNAVFDITIPRGTPGAAGAGTGDMLGANNLSDITNASSARGNLGLGTAATTAATDYATAAHNHTGVYSPVGHTHTISNITDISSFAATLLDDTTASAARSTLGLGSLATASTIAAANVTNQQDLKPKESFLIAVSDETTAITTGTAKVTLRMPYAFTLTDVRANVNTVSSSGVVTVDINEGGTSILSTKLTIDASEKTSVTAATAHVFSDTSLADDAEITIDIDNAGTGAKGLKVTLIGTRT